MIAIYACVQKVIQNSVHKCEEPKFPVSGNMGSSGHVFRLGMEKGMHNGLTPRILNRTQVQTGSCATAIIWKIHPEILSVHLTIYDLEKGSC